VGADADIAIWDPEKRLTLSNKLLHHNVDYTPFEGLEVQGWPETVISRGEIVVQRGKLMVEPGRGRFLEQVTSSAWGPVLGVPSWT
jgi:dihydropyrimidinase